MERQLSSGSEAMRGFHFQISALLLHLLIRRIELPTLDVKEMNVEIEPQAGGDATLRYCQISASGPERLTEYVECKKVESGDSAEIHPGAEPGDEYFQGTIDYDKFEGWLTSGSGGRTLLDLLQGDPGSFLTLIVFGRLTKNIGRYEPTSVKKLGNMNWDLAYYGRAFPASYRHPSDPAGAKGSSKIGDPDLRSRIRILRVESPRDLKWQCAQIAKEALGVSGERAFDVVDDLHSEIKKRALLANAEARQLPGAVLDRYLQAGRSRPRWWRPAFEVLKHDRPPGSTISSELLWSDFESGNFVPRPAMEEALRLIRRHGSVVICSPRGGTGSSTLARYVAFNVCTSGAGANCYFFSASDPPATEETDGFFRDSLAKPGLFIIEDEHLLPPERIDKLITTFVSFQQDRKCEAFLLVTSARKYSVAQTSLRPEEYHPLNQLPVIPAQRPGTSEFESLLAALALHGRLDPDLDRDRLTTLSECNLSLAMLLTKFVKDHRNPRLLETAVQRGKFSEPLRQWVMQRTCRPSGLADYRGEIGLLFVLGSHRLGVSEDDSTLTRALADAGFLEPATEGSSYYLPVSRHLAVLVAQAYRDEAAAIIEKFVAIRPHRLAEVCGSLRATSDGARLLHGLAETDSFRRRIELAIWDEDELLSLGSIARILESIQACNRPRAQQLVRDLLEPSGAVNQNFLAKFLRLDRIPNAGELASFFGTLYRIDRVAARKLPLGSLRNLNRYTIVQVIDSRSTRIDALGACLVTFARYSRDFARDLFESCQRSPYFAEKIQETNTAPDGPATWLSFCESLAYLDRRSSHGYVERYLRTADLADLVLKSPHLTIWPLFLRRFRRLYPRHAYDLAKDLLGRNLPRLIGKLAQVQEISDLASYLDALSKFSRRTTAIVANRLEGHLKTLIKAAQRDHRAIGSVLEVLRWTISRRLLSDLAGMLDTAPLIESLQKEPVINFSGRTLSNIFEISPPLARKIVKNLRLERMGQEQWTPFLNQFAYWLKGVLVAAGPGESQSFLEADAGRAWRENLREAWKKARPSEIALFLHMTLQIPLRHTDIYQLLDIPNARRLREDLEARFAGQVDPLDLALLVGALARFSREDAIGLLKAFVGSEGDSRWLFSRNLAHLGSLLHVAASIDPPSGRQLVHLLERNTLIRITSEESNLGWVSQFLLGLLRSSRRLALNYTAEVATEDVWTRQLEENDGFKNVAGYAYALSRVSRAKGLAFSRFLQAKYRKDIEDTLEIEGDLASVSNWARLLSSGNQQLTAPVAKRVAELVEACLSFETHVVQLLDAAQAMIQCGQQELAKRLAFEAQANSRQLDAIHDLELFLTVLLRTNSIVRNLGLASFSSRLFAKFDVNYLVNLIRMDPRPVLAAHAVFLLGHLQISGLLPFTRATGAILPYLRDRALRDDNTTNRVFTLILTRASLEQVRNEASSGKWDLAEAGLASIFFECIYPRSAPLFGVLPPGSKGEAGAARTADMMVNLNDEAGNLPFGLVLNLARKCGLSVAKFSSAAAARRDDERHGAGRWLLGENPNPAELLGKPHHQAYLLGEVLLPIHQTNELSALEDSVIQSVLAWAGR